MTHYQLITSCIILILLIFLSAFFSAAETSLMAVNRYRLRHKAKMKKHSAILILRLLKRPDRLLGVILTGSTICNIFASSIVTFVAVHFLDEQGVVIATTILIFVILIFAEMVPKTVSALYPDNISRWLAWPLFWLLKLGYPLVWVMNIISNSVLRLFQIKVTGHILEPLSREELHTIVHETSGRLPHQYQNMLLSILDLNNISVNAVMVPQHEVLGIDLDQDIHTIQQHIMQTKHDWLPLYRDHINQVVGVLYVRDLMRVVLAQHDITKELLVKMAQEPYFVPEGTTLNVQLLNFQREDKRMAFVVDEYGEVQGLLTLVDIVEEIIGEFAKDITEIGKLIKVQKDGSYLVDGSITIRELNRMTQWQLPVQGPRTLSGLIIEHLESIPKENVCLKINNYPIEIVKVENNLVKAAKIFPAVG